MQRAAPGEAALSNLPTRDQRTISVPAPCSVKSSTSTKFITTALMLFTLGQAIAAKGADMRSAARVSDLR